MDVSDFIADRLWILDTVMHDQFLHNHRCYQIIAEHNIETVTER